ncbi:MAG: TIGR03915 family putative DNA repair protein [Eggerthellaceae bacterium]|jgi:hypothetical protein|nr:TIGR03915 family putative DNA repair protein [Eggerthellaceae bacterium]MCH4220696.1 TIGR03915 family putative DNA repair protein [Eggerthellaceae bacterium]
MNSHQNAHGVSNETPVVYECADSVEGILSAIFSAYAFHEQPTAFHMGAIAQLSLTQQTRSITTDLNHAQRVAQGIERKAGREFLNVIMRAATSDNNQRGTIIYQCVRRAMNTSKHNPCATCRSSDTCHRACSRARSQGLLCCRADPTIAPLLALDKNVSNEIEHMKQFIRFEQCDGSVWYARCNPNASVMPYIMPWFIARFNTQHFLIYDENHHLAGLWDGKAAHIVVTDTITPPPRTQREHDIQRAWKTFYQSVSITERYHPELRRHFMPKRLWRNITEVATNPSEVPPYNQTQG